MLVTNDVLPTEILRHGAYACLQSSDADITELIARLGFANEFDATNGHPTDAFALLRRVDATPRDLADGRLMSAGAIVHVASPSESRVAEFCAEVGSSYVLRGVVRPMSYTGGAMHNFAYAHQVAQQSGSAMPNAFLVPMSKTAAWWAKDWMERHTYLLPRYDDAGRMVNEGHALAAAAGISCLMRRTYKNATEPATDGAYDFLTYFECADADVPRFHEVCAALRDTARNPEWKFVREGPTWQGRRVRTWAELFRSAVPTEAPLSDPDHKAVAQSPPHS